MAMMMANRWSVRKAVEAERRRTDHVAEENRRLREDLNNMAHLNDCRDAMRRGRELERKSPANAAEQFARNFEGRRVQFKGVKSA